jgi:hypothetical protein
MGTNSFRNNATAATSVYELLSLYNEQFVRSAFITLLGREPDPDGMKYYLGRLRDGYGKKNVIFQLAKSEEAKNINADLDGLSELITNYKISTHWLWGWVFRRRHLEQQVNQLEFKLGCIANLVDQKLGFTELSSSELQIYIQLKSEFEKQQE